MTFRASPRRASILTAAARAGMALVAAAVLIAAAPVTLAAAVFAWLAWRRGWPPGRLARMAGWCVPMVVVWLAVTGISRGGLLPMVTAPYDAWLAMWHDGSAGAGLAAALVVAPGAVPLGLLAASLAWSARNRAMQAQAGGLSPGAAIAFDQRQWRHQVRAAKAGITAPGSVPLLTANGHVGVGAVIRTVGHRTGPVARIPADRLRSHQIVVGGTGTGKTTLLLRLWAAYMASGLSRHAAGLAGPPLIVVLDCKGGADARRVADRVRRVLRDAGARTVAVWPDEASLSLWALAPGQLVTTLVDLIEHGTGGAAYYTDVMEAVVAMAVDAPAGPPASSAEFLSRLDPGWLTLAYSAGGYDEQLAQVRAAARQVQDIALRFRTLFRRLGDGLDGPGNFGDADVWYCILEGTSQIAVAEAQARALTDLLAGHVTADLAGRCQVLLAVDEFSAVARRLPIWALYERARSLGLVVQVSAQSWHGLAPADADRYRIAATAEGGIWLLRAAYPEPVTELAGTRTAVTSSRWLRGFPLWGRQGSSRLADVPVADPSVSRRLETGQVGYIYRGGVTYIQVKRMVAGPAALPSARGPAVAAASGVHAGRTASAGRTTDAGRTASASRTGSASQATSVGQAGPAAAPPLPDIRAFLDTAFGPEAPAAAGPHARRRDAGGR